MNIVITTIENTSNVSLPITLFFWGYVVAYTIHIIDESILGETFVVMVRKNFWPEYKWKHFFGFNTLLMSLIIFSNILYEIFGGNLIILPLILFSYWQPMVSGICLQQLFKKNIHLV